MKIRYSAWKLAEDNWQKSDSGETAISRSDKLLEKRQYSILSAVRD